MKIQDLLLIVENYKTALTKFSKHADEDEIRQYFDKFKRLANKNLINKDISFWIKQGWDSFKKEIDLLEQHGVKSKREQKKRKNKGNAITLVDTDSWLIVIPLDKDASCFYGKDTEWCTAKPQSEYFKRYFYRDEVTLIYLFDKDTNKKFAIAHTQKEDLVELFDENDDIIEDEEEFEMLTGWPVEDVLAMVAPQHKEKMKKDRLSMEEINNTLEIKMDNMDYVKKNRKEIEILINKTSNASVAYEYVRNFPDTKDDKIWLLAIESYPRAILHHENPSQKLQKRAVEENSSLIKELIDKGVATDNVIKSAVQEHPDSIQYVKNPSPELVKIALDNGRRNRYEINDMTHLIQARKLRLNDQQIQYARKLGYDI